MFVPEGARPEEVQKLVERPEWPFLEVRALLASHGVDVPRSWPRTRAPAAGS